MGVKVGINGFGRVGRVIFRTCLEHSDVEIAAINDPAVDVDYMCYLIKFDSTHGKLTDNISHINNEIKINDKLVKVFRQKLPTSIPWKDAGVQYVVEASGMFTSVEKATGHLTSETVKCIIVTAPSADVPMIILGVNDIHITEQKVISCGSSTLYCLAPIVKLLDDHFGIEDGFVTSIHAMTPSLKPLDGLCLRGKHWRDHRSIHQNIIPATTGACKALGKVIPSVKDKLAGLAFRVPIVNVSVLDLTIRLTKTTTLQDIVQVAKRESNGSFKNIMKVSKDEAVSSDFAADSHSCVLDVQSCLELKPNYYKLICWYENEYSYACRVIDSILQFEKRITQPLRPSSKITVLNLRPVKKQDMVQQTDCCIRDKHLPRMFHSFRSPALKQVSQRSITMRKPFLTNPIVNESARDKNEVFKVWNEENIGKKTNQNRSSLFQSCITFGTQQQKNECLKAQERLDKVKQEFSKMVNITEDLLKKSQTDNLKHQHSIKSATVDVVSIERMEPVEFKVSSEIMCNKKLLDKCKTIQIDSAMFDISGDGKSISTVNSKVTNDTKMSLDKDGSDLSFTAEKMKKFGERSKTLNSEILQQTINGKDNNTNKITENISQRSNLKEHVTKTINTIIEGLSKNFQIQPCDSQKTEEIANKTDSNFFVIPKIIETGTLDYPINNLLRNELVNKSDCPLNEYQTHESQRCEDTIDIKENVASERDEQQRLEHIASNFKTRFNFSNQICLGKPQNHKLRTSQKFSDIGLKNFVPNIIVHTELGKADDDDDDSIKSNITSNTYKPHVSINNKGAESVNDKQRQLLCKKKDCLFQTDPYLCTSKNSMVKDGSFNTMKLKLILNENNQVHDLKETPSELSNQEKEKLLEHLMVDALKRSVDNTQKDEDQHKATKNIDKISDDLVTIKFNIPYNEDGERALAEIRNGQENNKTIKLSRDKMEIHRTLKLSKYSSITEIARLNAKRNSIASEDESLSSSQKTSNISAFTRKVDLYDKLDSASATDSDNSLENIGGRKSQVIDITDLTNSLEDIVRLDKICRIMEISDELSDKLFSSLKNPDNVASNKKWSFKDLCERINLDDFCNKVFGQSSP